jgi:membrane fusion protein (multidrug efflux system)
MGDLMKAFCRGRYRRIDGVTASIRLLDQVTKILRNEQVRSRSQLRVAFVIVLCLISRASLGSEVLEQKFDGIVAPSLSVQVVPQVDGVISRILVAPGQRVSKGDILFEIEPDDFAIEVRIAQSELAEARARLSLAEDASARQAELLKKNSTAKELARRSEIEVEIAHAIVARNEGALAKAQLALSRTRIAAPLSGTVGRPHVAPGAFVEAAAEAAGGTVLAEVVQLDPVLVSFFVPYVERQRAFEKAGTFAVPEVFQRSTLALELPSGHLYEHIGKAEYSVTQIDQATDMMTLWAVFPNPNNVLVPGLKVRIISRLTD